MTVAISSLSSSQHPLSRDSRPLAALALTAEDLPNLPWESDETGSNRFAVIEFDGNQFGLESEDDAPEKQTTIYGVDAGDALDGLLAALRVDEADVLDRVDRRAEAPANQELYALQRQVLEATAQIKGRLVEFETRASLLEAERKAAAAALFVGGNELTERQKQILSLMVTGWTADEIAEILSISRSAVLRHKREGIGRYHAVGSGKTMVRLALGGTDSGDLTPREMQVVKLAAHGLSDAEIAKTLFVTTKTIEWHLRKASDKLDVHSRGELVTRFVHDDPLRS